MLNLGDWLMRHPQFRQNQGGVQGITDPPPMPLPGQPAPQAYANASPQGQANGAAFQPGFNIGQLLMRLPHQGAGYMQRPQDLWNARFPQGMPNRGLNPGYY